MTPGLEFQTLTTRFNVVHANFCAAHTVSEAGFNVIDLHYYSLFQTFRRNRDGIHWSPEANRFVSNTVITHVSLAYGMTLPNKNQNDYALKRVIYMSKVAQGNFSDKKCEEMIKDLDKIVENIMKLKPEKKKQFGKKWWEKIKQLPSVSELTNGQENGPMGPNEPFGNTGPMGPNEPMWQNCPMGPNGPMGPKPHGNYNPDQNNFME